MNIFIVGIGLIGGSFAKDIRRIIPEAKIFGIDTNEAHLEEALALRLIDVKSSYAELGIADMVIVSIPVDVLVDELPKILDVINDDCVVFDGGSTKNLICAKLEDHPKRRNYLSAHPIAGTEFSGPSAAIEGLYEGKTNIICEVEKTAFKLQERALELFRKMGMRIRYMNPEAHGQAYSIRISFITYQFLYVGKDGY